MLDSYNFAAVTKEVSAAFLFAKLTDKVTDPLKSRKFAAKFINKMFLLWKSII